MSMCPTFYFQLSWKASNVFNRSFFFFITIVFFFPPFYSFLVLLMFFFFFLPTMQKGTPVIWRCPFFFFDVGVVLQTRSQNRVTAQRAMREMLVFPLAYSFLYSVLPSFLCFFFFQRAQLMPRVICCFVIPLSQKKKKKLPFFCLSVFFFFSSTSYVYPLTHYYWVCLRTAPITTKGKLHNLKTRNVSMKREQ